MPDSQSDRTMHRPGEREQFAPPRPGARLRAWLLALFVHLVLIVALTWGLHWHSSAEQPPVFAQLWAALPAPDPKPPAPSPAPPEPPAPPVPATPAPERRQQQQPPPEQRDTEIALAREKKRLEQEQKARAQREELKAREEQKAREEKLQEQKLREDKARAEQQERARQQESERRERRDAEQRSQAERLQKKKEKEQRDAQLAEDKRRAEQAAKRQTEADAQQLARQHEDHLRRIQGLAGAGESSSASGAARAGPSAGYGDRVTARVRPNIVYPDLVAGNPRAEVEVRLAPDGTIVGKRLTQPSGSRAWDDAVLRALEKTQTLPRDVDGTIPRAPFVIVFRPQG